MARQPRIKNWAAFHRRQQATAQQALAEGMQRPAPGLTPPLTQDERMAQQAAEAGKEAQEEPTSD